MTLFEPKHPNQCIVDRDGSMFIEWVIKNQGSMFAHKIDQEYTNFAEVHFLMKRLGESYGDLMNMHTDTRRDLFNREMELYKEEQRKNG